MKAVSWLSSGNSNAEIANRFGIPLGESPASYLTPPQLSQNMIPNEEDIRSVRAFALKMTPFFGIVQNRDVQFSSRNQRLFLSARTTTGKETTVNNASRAWYYSQRSWAASLDEAGRPTIVSSVPASELGRDVVPLYSVDAFKGLECDALVLFINAVNPNLLREIYVGSSRAVCYLNIVVSRSVWSRLTTLADLDGRFLSK
jgi:hypothetical protein